MNNFKKKIFTGYKLIYTYNKDRTMYKVLEKYGIHI